MRSVIFSGPLIPKVMDGTKTQTRRLMNPQPEFDPNIGLIWNGGAYGITTRQRDSNPEPFLDEIVKQAPHGRPGDRLRVRETWGLHAYGDETDWHRGSVRGLSENAVRQQFNLAYRADWGPLQEGCFWRPAIFMPNWASRTTILLLRVRLERLMDISEEDAQAEGISGPHLGRWTDVDGRACPPDNRPPRPWAHSFFVAWKEIHGVDSSAIFANPWVWAYTFRKVTDGPHEGSDGTGTRCANADHRRAIQ